MAIEMGYFKLSLLLQITHMIFYTWFGLLNLLLVWNMQGFSFFLTHTWFIKETLISFNYVSRLDWLNAVEVV